jgi:hypothetical protein
MKGKLSKTTCIKSMVICVVWEELNISEEHTASIFRVEELYLLFDLKVGGHVPWKCWALNYVVL